MPCAVVAIETAPASKMERMKALGARLIPVPYEVAWKALDERAYAGLDGTFVHPFDDHNFIAGHGTMGLEILEDAPDTVAVMVAVPALVADTSPPPLTVALPPWAPVTVQLTLALLMEAPFASRTVAVAWVVAPSRIEAAAKEIVLTLGNSGQAPSSRYLPSGVPACDAVQKAVVDYLRWSNRP